MRLLIAVMISSLPFGCNDASQPTPSPPGSQLPPRAFRMGFSANPPQATVASGVATIEAWTPRADAAIMHVSVPYKAMLAGTKAAEYVSAVDLPLANYYRGKRLPVTITVDVTDGLNRAGESRDLVELGRSIAEPEIQQLYRQYVTALVAAIRPEYLGLAAETNLIREQAPAGVYSAMVHMTNDVVDDVRALGGAQPALFASVQADVAWGPPPGAYRGAETDFRDFPFMEVLALSSYPYFVFDEPEEIPLEYYTRIRNGRALPIMVVESGWTSASTGTIASSPEKQARYVRRQAELLDASDAIAFFQLNYTDIDISAYPSQPPGSVLTLFTSIGFVTSGFGPKPALATYDSVFARPLEP